MVAQFLNSPILAGAGFRHAFFTRHGGHSRPPFDSLSFGSTGHEPEELAANVQVAADALAIEPDRLFLVTQVHGRDAIIVRGDERREDVLPRLGDVIVSAEPGVACGIKVADCVPVLVADRISGAVAAIHSGWQGTAVDVVGAGIAALRHALGADGDLVAAIGPHIEVCCFEVGEDVAERLRDAAPEADAVVQTRRRPRVDLRKVVRAQLRARGISNEGIDDVPGCTKCDAARFFSYRRDRSKSGRLLSAIVVRSAKKATP